MPPLPELVRFRNWILLILGFGLVGGAIGYFVDAGPNRIGLGLLIGMAFASHYAAALGTFVRTSA